MWVQEGLNAPGAVGLEITLSGRAGEKGREIDTCGCVCEWRVLWLHVCLVCLCVCCVWGVCGVFAVYVCVVCCLCGGCVGCV